ncbi:mitogen-activated protein kinase kinase kinase 7-like [Drosophila innubila]|uniref:mitogen-activated protein kinase kinase kinase 7-like n=1 Tax=Drosophila innubila TaxID=198719 RepID=UPI00148C8DCC|nr:mitogen-activated protein kinase kinase kinase 7-like [Drosophila innubila]
MGVIRQLTLIVLERTSSVISFFDSLNNLAIKEVSQKGSNYDALTEETPQETFNRVNSRDRKLNSLNTGDKEILGSGAFGVVYKSHFNDLPCAIKEVFVKDDDAKKNIEREVKYLSQAIHKNIIELYGTVEDKDSKFGIAMEFADCGTLYDYIHNKKGDQMRSEYSDSTALSWMCQLAEGLEYLHAMKPKPIIHRDIKTKNLLLTDNYRVLKIADFGTTREQATLMTKDYVGTPEYMAPEISVSFTYSEKSDVYSYGIVFWEVMSRKKPFYYLTNEEPLIIMEKVTKGERPPIEDTKDLKNVRNLIEKCWDKNPEKRPSMHNLVSELSIL